MIQLTTPGKHK